WTFGYDPNASPPIVLYPPDPGYDPVSHTYAWPLGSIDPNASGCVQLTVVVNEGAEPGRYLHNVAELWTTVYDPNGLQGTVVARAMVDTLVCCWDTNGILYVDKEAEGANSGVSWHDAYVDLQSALLRARTTECAEAYLIYVAEGTYSPGDDEDDTFDVPNGVYVYGGFKTGGCAFEERDPKRYKTILTGRIDETTRNDTIVTMGHETLLDGFTVTQSSILGQGIYGTGADFAVENCTIEKNYGYGIRASDGDVSVRWCNIIGNELDGIRHDGEGFALYVENCWVRRSGQYGIRCTDSTPIARNAIISESDLMEAGNAGVRMINPTYSPLLQNVTIAHNKAMGVSLVGSTLPEVQNCIIYHNNNHNNNAGPQLAGFSADDAAWYSCIQDCNSVNDNINIDPQFAYFDPNNVRIAYSSPCKDTGNPSLSYTEQLEMDRKDRVYGMAVDRGAYEVTCEDTSNDWDWNADGIVNLREFGRFAAVWRAHDPNDPAVTDPNHPDHEYVTEPNSPGYVAPEAMALWYPDGYPYNFSATGPSQYAIDVADLAIFVEDAPWLWMACWLTEGELLEMGFGEESQMGMMAFEAQPVEQEPAESQIKALVNLIGPLESLWLADPDIQQEIDSTDWQEFMDALYDNLLEVYLSTQ
ncbi:MAG TPA: right-handed parallel beta-helix repeat-containing protein, partial [Phycisphaerae bacterium]|nr:right-handed parallel beta-helix repeat-containing protein [Phycisphaerae bacterium]HRS13369.1 right-handed parallel beta-helix repeat-containing protein [Sedimentisphaerales bacterium]